MQVRRIFGEGQIIAPPRIDAPAMPATGFVMCPIAFPCALQVDCGIEEIYRLAYEQARSALRPTWYGRLQRAGQN
jgi:hypothetical protein